MNTRSLIAATVIAGAALLTATRVQSQDKKAQGGPPEGMPTPEQVQDMMKQWEALAKPGEQHKALEHFVGKWKLTTKMWMAGPGTEPTMSAGTTEVKWILGGRYLSEEVDSTMNMGPMGIQPFQGFGLTGYDNIRNLYQSCWTDTMGTQMMTMKGTRNPMTGVWTYYGEMDEPAMKMYGRLVKWEIKVLNNDQHVAAMYDLAVSNDFKVFEIAYERMK